MKNLYFLLLLCVILSGCAKTHEINFIPRAEEAGQKTDMGQLETNASLVAYTDSKQTIFVVATKRSVLEDVVCVGIVNQSISPFTFEPEKIEFYLDDKKITPLSREEVISTIPSYSGKKFLKGLKKSLGVATGVLAVMGSMNAGSHTITTYHDGVARDQWGRTYNISGTSTTKYVNQAEREAAQKQAVEAAREAGKWGDDDQIPNIDRQKIISEIDRTWPTRSHVTNKQLFGGVFYFREGTFSSNQTFKVRVPKPIVTGNSEYGNFSFGTYKDKIPD